MDVGAWDVFVAINTGELPAVRPVGGGGEAGPDDLVADLWLMMRLSAQQMAQSFVVQIAPVAQKAECLTVKFCAFQLR